MNTTKDNFFIQDPDNKHMSDLAIICNKLESRYTKMEYLQSEDFTLEVAYKAVSIRGDYLKFIPEHLKTRELCLMAVSRMIDAMLYVPGVHIDQDFIDFAFSSDDQVLYFRDEEVLLYNQFYSALPKSLLKSWHYKKLIEFNGIFLQWLPEEFIDYDTCFRALCSAGDGYLLKYVPRALIDSAICYQALQSDSEARSFIPEALWDAHCERIIKNNDMGRYPRRLL
ncbi:DUF4116 domain-containing protein [Vibrio agarivorans]|uniref:DUF4116 domain-containing protein n=1 Tax=Vibrio agarivorans TaxID=153622 RepID=UPI0025B5C876|nr:DUF4116 domain-containing protein [Vibrio agarivorans]MDN3660670.1 DUF4116 domain-containing protein [Vibrio agarivorans]